MASIGEMQIKVSADIAGLLTSMQRVEALLKKQTEQGEKTATALANIGKKAAGAWNLMRTAVVGVTAALASKALIGQLNQAAEVVDKIGKKAKAVGVTVESLSVLKFAADEAGVDFETLAKMAGKAQKTLAGFAAEGRRAGDSSLNSFMRGLVDADGSMQSIDQLLPRIADKLSRLGSQGEKLRFAETLFGRGGGEAFIQLIEDMGGSLAKLGDKAKLAQQLNVVFTDDQVEKLTAYNDAVGRIGQAWLGFRVLVMTEVAPFLTKLADDAAITLGKVARVAGNILRKITEAFGDGPEGQAARQQLKQFGLDLAQLLGDSIGSAGMLAGAALHDSLLAAWRIIAEDAEQWGLKIASKLVNPSLTWAYRLGEKLGEEFAFQALPREMREAMDKAGLFNEQAPDRLSFTKRMQGASFPNTEFAYISMLHQLSGDVDQLGQSLSGLELGKGLREAADAAMSLQRALSGSGRGPLEEGNWGKFVSGVKDGFKALEERANDFAALGRGIITEFATGLSSGIADALVDGAASFRNFGKAALDVLNNVLKRIASMALEFAIMRALVGIGGSIPFFQSGPATQPAAGTVGPPVPGRAGGGDVAPGGWYMVGERGPELLRMGRRGGSILPADKTAALLGGRPGVIVQVIDQRSGGARPQVSEQQGPDGRRLIQVLIRDEMKGAIRDGALDRAAAEAWGVRRVPGQR